MLELWIFLNRISKQGIRGIRDFFDTALIWLSHQTPDLIPEPVHSVFAFGI